MKISVNYKTILLLLFTLCSSVLIVAYISQYVFDHKPCILCLYQRIPYFFIVVASATGLILLKNERLTQIMIILSILALLTNSAIAFYHSGVEQKVFKMTEKCDDPLSSLISLQELRQAINNTKIAKCDEPSFFFLGLSMAVWNMIFSFSLAILTIFLYKRRQT